MNRDEIFATYSQTKEVEVGEKKEHRKQQLSKVKSFITHILKHPKLLFLSISLFIIFTLIAIPVLTYIYFASDIYSKEKIMNRNNVGVTLLDRNDKEFFTFYQPQNKTLVPLSDIPVHTQQAVIAIEDKDFYKHGGFSITAIGRCFIANIISDQVSCGGSTITQQLVKNALLTPKVSLFRKYQEVVLATEIDRVYSKDEILEMYLNSVYFGQGAVGIEDATQAYFSKESKQLNLSESALLAGLLTAPSAYSPIGNDGEAAAERKEIVLNEMQSQGFISEREKTVALNTQIRFNPRKEDLNQNAPHFAIMVRDFLIEEYGEEKVTRSGMRVKTTLDLDWQIYAEEQVARQVAALTRNKTSNGAAVVIEPKTGEVRVLVGSKDWSNEQFGKVNIITSLRQPGSAFKPIVYGTGLDRRVITPATILHDKATTFSGSPPYSPKNYDNKFRGDVTVRRSLANSLNVPTIETVQMVGVDRIIDQAKKLGITSFDDDRFYGLAIGLGATEVTPLELTQVYATFANYGERVDTVIIKEILDKTGRSIYKSDVEKNRAISTEASFLISSILSDNAARAESFGNSLTLSRPAAVKTGTTEDYRDAWTVGYTPSLAVGVWVGNNDNSPMDRVAGSLGAAPIWRSLMERFTANTPKEEFSPKGSVVKELLCRGNESSSSGSEYFINGTQKGICQPGQLQTTPPATTPPSTPDPTPGPTQVSVTPSPTQAPTTSPTNPPLPTILPFPSQ